MITGRQNETYQAWFYGGSAMANKADNQIKWVLNKMPKSDDKQDVYKRQPLYTGLPNA